MISSIACVVGDSSFKYFWPKSKALASDGSIGTVPEYNDYKRLTINLITIIQWANTCSKSKIVPWAQDVNSSGRFSSFIKVLTFKKKIYFLLQ